VTVAWRLDVNLGLTVSCRCKLSGYHAVVTVEAVDMRWCQLLFEFVKNLFGDPSIGRGVWTMVNRFTRWKRTIPSLALRRQMAAIWNQRMTRSVMCGVDTPPPPPPPPPSPPPSSTISTHAAACQNQSENSRIKICRRKKNDNKPQRMNGDTTNGRITKWPRTATWKDWFVIDLRERSWIGLLKINVGCLDETSACRGWVFDGLFIIGITKSRQTYLVQTETGWLRIPGRDLYV
jgi:hypothetical protein